VEDKFMGALRAKWQAAKKECGIDASKFKSDLGPTLDEYEDTLKEFIKSGNQLHLAAAKIMELQAEIMKIMDDYAKMLAKEKGDTSGFARFGQAFLKSNRYAHDLGKELLDKLNAVQQALNKRVFG
jgi:hypothetical protein